MIKVQIHDTIVDIIDKIDSQEFDSIILDFPLGHPILHNYISLKILKSKLGDKKLTIATNDRIGKKICKRVGIEYSAIKDHNFIKEDTQGELMKHNFTFWEYFKFQIRTYLREIKNTLDANKKLNSLGKYSRIYQEKIPVHLFIGVFIFSILIFLFIYYFAISKTYISITPKIIVKKEAHNFIFKENIDNNVLGNNNLIKVNALSETIHSSDTYAATQIIRDPENISTGTVRIYNNTFKEITLVPQTRLQDKDGVIFEITSWAKIPPVTKDNFGENTPGNVDVAAVSQDVDINGKYVGERGNIKEGVSLIIPGLSIDEQKNIYAQSIEAFTGGRNDYKTIISEKDITSAKEIFTQKIKTEVIDSIKNNIFIENRENNSQIDILLGGESIYYSSPSIQIENSVNPGDEKDNFTIKGSITAYVYTYNKVDVIQKLKTLLNEKNLPGVEKISHVDESSLRMSEVIYSQTDPFEIKATFEVEGLFLHDFLHEENTYISTLKSQIYGLDKHEAEKILLNNTKISNVSIDIRPFFIKKISKIYNNIIFRIE